MKTRTEADWAMHRRTWPCSGTWHSMSCRRTAPRVRSAASSNGPDGRTLIWPSSLRYSEMRLPWVASLRRGAVAPCQMQVALEAQQLRPHQPLTVAVGAPHGGVQRALRVQEPVPGAVGAREQQVPERVENL